MGPDGSASYDAERPAVAYNVTNNEYLVVWQGEETVVNEFDIYGQRLNAATGAAVGTNDFRISDMGPNNDATFSAYAVAVAHNTINNQYLVTWRGDDTQDEVFEIYGQLLDDTGTEIGSNDFRLSVMGPESDPNYGAWNPAVAHNAIDNEYLVCWFGDTDSEPLVNEEYEVFCQRVAATTGVLITGPTWVSDMGPYGDPAYKAFSPSVAFNLAENEYLVVWSGLDDTLPVVPGEMEIYGQLLNGAGTPIGVNDFRISEMGPDGNINYDADLPFVAYNSRSNEYLVVWTADDDAGQLVDDEYEVYAQRISATGAQLGANDVRLSDLGPDGATPYTKAAEMMGGVAYNSTNNEYLVIWYGSDNTPPLVVGEQEVFGQRYVIEYGLHLPTTLRHYIHYYEGPNEEEQNDSADQANGPLRSDKDYSGAPDDQRDYFKFTLATSGQITVSLSNHVGSGVQLQLFYESTANRVAFDTSAPYQISYTGPPGIYYIYIFTESGFSASPFYTLRVTYPILN